MRWRNMIVSVVAIVVPAVYADSLEDALDRAAQLLNAGQPAEAILACQEARVEYPQSPDLLFALGCAQADLADRMIEDGRTGDAAEHYREARATFDRCTASGRVRLREGSAYNAATCLLRLDAAFDPESEYAARVDNLNAAVEELAALQKAYPENERVRKNLDHARYRLALLLQSPPREEEKPEEEDGEDEPEKVSEVVDATTQLPGATVEVVNGSTVVLRFRANGESPQ